DRLAARAPMPMRRIEDAGAGRATFATAPVCRQVPSGEVIPIAADEHRATTMAVSALPHAVVDIAGIDVTKTGLERDAPRCLERLRRRPRGIQHLPVRMKGREMQRHVGTEAIHHPAALPLHLFPRVLPPATAP